MTDQAIRIASVFPLLAFALGRFGRVTGIPSVIVLIAIGLAVPIVGAIGLDRAERPDHDSAFPWRQGSVTVAPLSGRNRPVVLISAMLIGLVRVGRATITAASAPVAEEQDSN